MVSRANTLGVVSITRDLDARCPVLMWPLPPKRFRFSLRRVFSGKRIVLIGISWWRVSPPPINSLDDGHRQWPSGIEGLPVLSPASLFLSGLPLSCQEGRSVAGKPPKSETVTQLRQKTGMRSSPLCFRSGSSRSKRHNPQHGDEEAVALLALSRIESRIATTPAEGLRGARGEAWARSLPAGTCRHAK